MFGIPIMTIYSAHSLQNHFDHAENFYAVIYV